MTLSLPSSYYKFSPLLIKKMYWSDVLRTDSSIRFYLSKLSRAKFSVQYEVSLVRNLGRMLMLHSWECNTSAEWASPVIELIQSQYNRRNSRIDWYWLQYRLVHSKGLNLWQVKVVYSPAICSSVSWSAYKETTTHIGILDFSRTFDFLSWGEIADNIRRL